MVANKILIHSFRRLNLDRHRYAVCSIRKEVWVDQGTKLGKFITVSTIFCLLADLSASKVECVSPPQPASGGCSNSKEWLIWNFL